jgi:hemolysin III
MMGNTLSARYTVGEEIAHAVTHGFGILLSIAGLAVLVAYASLNGDAWCVFWPNMNTDSGGT